MPEKLERCVRKVKAKGGVRNAWAVCKASIYGKKKKRKNPKKRTNALWKVIHKERMKKHA